MLAEGEENDEDKDVLAGRKSSRSWVLHRVLGTLRPRSCKFGAQVVLLDVGKTKGEMSAKDSGSRWKAYFMKCGVTSEKTTKRSWKGKNKFGRLDILHNNAGIT